MPTRKILSIDDARTVRLLVRKALQSYDVVMCEAANGQEGLAVAFAEKPDLILLDVTMPVMDGVTTLIRLKDDPELKRIPVVMLTAEAGRELVLKVVQLGARDYLVKPFTDATLFEKINRIIPLDRAADPDHDKKLLLLVEDKIAVVKQVTAGVQDPDWLWQHVATTAEALAIVDQRHVAAVVVSLALPDNAAFTLQTDFRARPHGAETAFLGLALKTATEVRERAQAAGFIATADKPIDPANLAEHLRSALRKQSADHAVRLSDELLKVVLTEGMTEPQTQAALEAIANLAPEAVDSGFRTAVFECSHLTTLTEPVVKLIAAGISNCEQVGLTCVLLGSTTLAESGQAFPEAKSWQFQEHLVPAGA